MIGRDALAIFLDGKWAAIVVDHSTEDAFVLSRYEVEDLVRVTKRNLPLEGQLNYGLPATPPPEGFLDEMLARARETGPPVYARGGGFSPS